LRPSSNDAVTSCVVQVAFTVTRYSGGLFVTVCGAIDTYLGLVIKQDLCHARSACFDCSKGPEGVGMLGSGARRRCQVWRRAAMVASMLVAGSAVAASGTGPVVPAASAAVGLSAPNPGPQPPLLPAPGQFLSVPMFRALDTRNGTGEQGGAAQLGAGHSLAVAVTGIDGVPADATSVVVNVVALNATASGYLTTYNSDIADPNVASVGVKSGISTNQTDTIPVSSTGTVSVANHTSASLDVVITLMGYYTGSSDSAAGDTYGDARAWRTAGTDPGWGERHGPGQRPGRDRDRGGHRGAAVERPERLAGRLSDCLCGADERSGRVGAILRQFDDLPGPGVRAAVLGREDHGHQSWERRG